MARTIHNCCASIFIGIALHYTKDETTIEIIAPRAGHLIHIPATRDAGKRGAGMYIQSQEHLRNCRSDCVVVREAAVLDNTSLTPLLPGVVLTAYLTDTVDKNSVQVFSGVGRFFICSGPPIRDAAGKGSTDLPSSLDAILNSDDLFLTIIDVLSLYIRLASSPFFLRNASCTITLCRWYYRMRVLQVVSIMVNLLLR